MLPLSILAVGVGLLGCGGDEDTTSKEEFAKNANQICRETEKEFEQIGQSAESPEELVDVLDKAIDKSQAAADDLVALERPEGADGDAATKFVEGFKSELNEKLVPAIEDLKQAVKDKDAQAVQEAAQQLQQLEATQSDRYARELGATSCVG
jgi:flagellin-specific chaperone FliS